MIKTPINEGILQSDLDCAGFALLHFPVPPATNGVPAGGTTGQSLTKISNTDYDTNWSTVTGGGVGRKFDVKTYGAIGNGTTDDTTAIAAALAAIPSTGGVLYFPPGQYKYAGTTLTLDRQITVEGDGGGVEASSLTDSPALAISTIDFNSATGTLFTVAANGCTFKNLELRNTSSTTPSAGAGIVVSSGGDRTSYDNLSVNGFYIGIDVQKGWMDTFDNCYIIAPVLYGLRLANAAMSDYGDHSISNCEFLTAKSRAATSAIRIESGGGIKIVNTKINSMALMAYPWVNGIDMAVASSVATSDLLVSNCSIENYSGYGIKGTVPVGSIWNSIIITGNEFGSFIAGQNPYAISLVAADFNLITGVVITGNWGVAQSSSNPMIYLEKISYAITTGNAMNGFVALLNVGPGVIFSSSYIGPDARLTPVTGGVKLEVRNPSTNTWVSADQWTNP